MISIFKRTNLAFVVVFLFTILSSTNVAAQFFSAETPVSTAPGRWFKAGLIGGVPGPLAPPLAGTIEGINFDEDATNTSFFHVPPDPIGAVGPNHVVSVVNTSIEWHTKAGVEEHSESLADFFTSLTPLTGTFDPKVIYDQFEDRFVVVTLERVDDGDGDNTADPDDVSRILLAVTDDSDPNGTGHLLSIDAKTTIGGIDHWADYPGFAVDEEAIYITNNMFSFDTNSFGGVRLWIVHKGVVGGFYAGGAATVTVHDPIPATAIKTTTQPAHIFGAGALLPPGTVGTWLCSYSGISGGGFEVLQIIRVDDPLGSPTFTHLGGSSFFPLGNIDDTSIPTLPAAPQSGTNIGIATNDRRALHAVWRNNSLWTTFQVIPPIGDDAGQVTAHWVEIDTTTLGTPALADQGNVGGEDIAAGTHTFFPSIAVDSAGNMGIGFAASASTIFPGAYYTGRFSTDAPGTVQPSVTLAAGEDFYDRIFGSGTRWGDYSGISIDPNDDKTFWVFNMYALTRGTPLSNTGLGRWGTRWGNFSFSSEITVSKTMDLGGTGTSPGATDVPCLQLGVVADTASGTISNFKVSFTGTSTAQDSDISAFDLHHDVDGDGTVSGGDVLLGSATFSSGMATVTGLSFNVTTTSKNLLLALDIAPGADASRTVGLELTNSTFITTSFGTVATTNFPIANSSDKSLPIELSSFTGTITLDGVQLRWQTESETNNLGFHIYRSKTKDGDYVRITPAVIKGHGSDSTPYNYSFLDETAEEDQSHWYLIEDIDFSGIIERSDPIQVVFDRQAALQKVIPTRFALHQNYPNPFNPDTWIPYDLAANANVSVTIYNEVGQKIRTLSIGAQPAGIYLTKEKAAYWDGRSDTGEFVSSGVYFYYLHVGDFRATKKMIILK